MARHIRPRGKINRRFGVALFGPSKALERRAYAPGVHGNKGHKKQSDYAVALGEKQKLKFAYGIMEKQFRRYYQQALRKKGITGENLLQFLELRLDNIVHRLGFATTRRYSRQMVSHGHIRVNGRKVSIPSYGCRQGDVIEVKDLPKARRMAAMCLEASQLHPVPDWLSLQKESFKGTVARIPTRDEIAPIANEQLVVELYSRS
ncbi:MAG: 30S ribosomal protein S4 [Verrucomicrobiota bacterium]